MLWPGIRNDGARQIVTTVRICLGVSNLRHPASCFEIAGMIGECQGIRGRSRLPKTNTQA
jgi:hypothetical protein